MSVMQVFKKPGQRAYSYSAGYTSVTQAAQTGLELAQANPEVWGEFLYARPVQQLPIQLDEFYLLRPSQLQVRYRKESEELDAPFDYLCYTGPQSSAIGFPLAWNDVISGGAVSLTAWFEAGKAFKFWDLCKSHVAKFVLRDGEPLLEFFHPLTRAQVATVPLKKHVP